MNTISVTLSSLVDRVLLELQDPTTMPLHSTLAAGITASETTLTLASADSVNISDVLECGSELMLVTGKTSDPIPVITVSRGYYSSTAAVHAIGAVVAVNPRHPRVRVADAIKRAYPRLEALGLPLVETTTMNRAAGAQYVVLAESTRDVLRVGYVHTVSGRWYDLGNWEMIDNYPTSLVASGKVLRLSSAISDDDDLQVTCQVPYRWSTWPAAPTEAATITMVEGSEDLPAVYATAWLLSRREIARTDLSRSEEWNQGEPSRGGVSAATVRLQWQEFYRALDEAKRLVPGSVPVHRPYLTMSRI